MRRTTHVTPTLETMDSKLLLTAHAMGGLATIAAVSTPTPVKTIELSGSVHGIYHQVTKNPDIGTTYTFFGSGKVGGLGHAAVTGHINKVGFIAVGPPSGTLFLSDARGTVTLKITGASQNGPHGLPTLFTFKVVGGTGAFRHEHGGGSLTLDLTSAPMGTASATAMSTGGHFSINFYAAPPPAATT